MRLGAVDLNLLTALHALLEESSVTLAARRTGVTQPAMSNSLRRLRELLGDDLLVRTSAGMRPTRRGHELRSQVRAAIEAAEQVLQAAPRFEPATAVRSFAIGLVDMTAFHLLPSLVDRLLRVAPGVRLDVRAIPVDRIEDALASELDLIVAVFRDTPASVRDAPLWRERFVCVVRKGGPASRGKLDLARYLELPHLLVTPRGRPGSALDDMLAAAGHQRRIVMTLPHFLVAPQIVATSDLVWTAPDKLARAYAAQLPLTLREPPLDIPGFQFAMRWHLRLDRDPGLAWLRGVIEELAGDR